MRELRLERYSLVASDIQGMATSGLIQYLMKQSKVSSIAQLIKVIKKQGENVAVVGEEISHFWYLKNQGQPLRRLDKLKRIEQLFPQSLKQLDHVLFELISVGRDAGPNDFAWKVMCIHQPDFLVNFNLKILPPEKIRKSSYWKTAKMLSQVSTEGSYEALACLLYYYYTIQTCSVLHFPGGISLHTFLENLLLKTSADIEKDMRPSYIKSQLMKTVHSIINNSILH
ncbi:hypothetical protein OAP14_02570 [Aliiglaciecola sp.]|nr:hypothetical protein [Aliiglaciecola sp.]